MAKYLKTQEDYDLKYRLVDRHGHTYTQDAADALVCWVRFSSATAPVDEGPYGLSPAYEGTPITVTSLPFRSGVGVPNRWAVVVSDGNNWNAKVTDAAGRLSMSTLPDNGTPTYSTDMPFSVSCWAKLGNAPTADNPQSLFAKQGQLFAEYEAYVEENYKIRFKLTDEDNSDHFCYAITAANAVALGEWYHFVFTYKPTDVLTTAHTGLKIYLNGSLLPTTSAQEASFIGMVPKLAEELYIAADADGPGNHEWDGVMSEFAVWKNHTLTADEVAAIYFATFAANVHVYKKSSGVVSEPVRHLVGRDDFATGSYPSYPRTGDVSRIGNKPIHYDDTKSLPLGARIRGGDYTLYPNTGRYETPTITHVNSEKITFTLAHTPLNSAGVKFIPEHGSYMFRYNPAMIGQGNYTFPEKLSPDYSNTPNTKSYLQRTHAFSKVNQGGSGFVMQLQNALGIVTFPGFVTVDALGQEDYPGARYYSVLVYDKGNGVLGSRFYPTSEFVDKNSYVNEAWDGGESLVGIKMLDSTAYPQTISDFETMIGKEPLTGTIDYDTGLVTVELSEKYKTPNILVLVNAIAAWYAGTGKIPVVLSAHLVNPGSMGKVVPFGYESLIETAAGIYEWTNTDDTASPITVTPTYKILGYTQSQNAAMFGGTHIPDNETLGIINRLLASPSKPSDIRLTETTIQGHTDKHLHFSPGEDLVPFDDTRINMNFFPTDFETAIQSVLGSDGLPMSEGFHPFASNLPSRNSFYSKGTMVRRLWGHGERPHFAYTQQPKWVSYPGLTTPTRSKTALVIDINPSTQTEVFWATGSNSGPPFIHGPAPNPNAVSTCPYATLTITNPGTAWPNATWALLRMKYNDDGSTADFVQVYAAVAPVAIDYNLGRFLLTVGNALTTATSLVDVANVFTDKFYLEVVPGGNSTTCDVRVYNAEDTAAAMAGKMLLETTHSAGYGVPTYAGTGTTASTFTAEASPDINSGMAYFNFVNNTWEIAGLSRNDVVTGSNVDYVHDDVEVFISSSLAFTPSHPYIEPKEYLGIGGTAGIAPSPSFYLGRPTTAASFPSSHAFDATGSQTLSMSDYITEPFILEKVVVEFSAKFPPYDLINTHQQSSAKADAKEGYLPMVYNFFLLNQRKNDVSQQLLEPNYLPLGRNASPGPSHEYASIPMVKKLKDLVWNGSLSMISGSISVISDEKDPPYALSDAYQQRRRDTTLRLTSKQVLSGVTGSFMIEAPAGTPAFSSGLASSPKRGQYWDATRGLPKETYLLGHDGTRTGIKLISNRSLLRGTPGCMHIGAVLDLETSAVGAGTKRFHGTGLPRNTEMVLSGTAPNKTSRAHPGPTHGYRGAHIVSKPAIFNSWVDPYLLHPSDQLVLGFWGAPHLDPGNEDTLSTARVVLTPGVGKLTLYGSTVRNSLGHNDTLNQTLTSDAIHETDSYGTLAHDQYDTEPISEFYGSYVDDVIQGPRFRKTGGVSEILNNYKSWATLGIISPTTTEQVKSARGVKGRKSQGANHITGTRGPMLRGVKLHDLSEQYYDTMVPKPMSLYLIDKAHLYTVLSGTQGGDPGHPGVPHVAPSGGAHKWPSYMVIAASSSFHVNELKLGAPTSTSLGELVTGPGPGYSLVPPQKDQLNNTLIGGLRIRDGSANKDGIPGVGDPNIDPHHSIAYAVDLKWPKLFPFAPEYHTIDGQGNPGGFSAPEPFLRYMYDSAGMFDPGATGDDIEPHSKRCGWPIKQPNADEVGSYSEFSSPGGDGGHVGWNTIGGPDGLYTNEDYVWSDPEPRTGNALWLLPFHSKDGAVGLIVTGSEVYNTKFGTPVRGRAIFSSETGHHNVRDSRTASAEAVKYLYSIGNEPEDMPTLTPTRDGTHGTPQGGVHATGIRGFKYGLMNVVPMFTSAVYRRDRYGQFRDMLEQRQFAVTPRSKRFTLSSTEPVDEEGMLLPAVDVDITAVGFQSMEDDYLYPVECTRITLNELEDETVGNGIFGGQGGTEEETQCSNLSLIMTSSIPYIDRQFRNRVTQLGDNIDIPVIM